MVGELTDYDTREDFVESVDDMLDSIDSNLHDPDDYYRTAGVGVCIVAYDPQKGYEGIGYRNARALDPEIPFSHAPAIIEHYNHGLEEMMLCHGSGNLSGPDITDILLG